MCVSAKCCVCGRYANYPKSALGCPASVWLERPDRALPEGGAVETVRPRTPHPATPLPATPVRQNRGEHVQLRGRVLAVQRVEQPSIPCLFGAFTTLRGPRGPHIRERPLRIFLPALRQIPARQGVSAPGSPGSPGSRNYRTPVARLAAGRAQAVLGLTPAPRADMA